MMAKTAKAGSADLIERNWNRTDLEPIMALVSQVRQGARIQADERLILFFLDFFRMGVGEQEAVAICDPLLIDLLLGHETVTPPSDAPASRRAEEERRAATAQTHYRKLFARARARTISSGAALDSAPLRCTPKCAPLAPLRLHARIRPPTTRSAIPR
jgi:hypothetical protein